MYAPGFLGLLGCADMYIMYSLTSDFRVDMSVMYT